MSFWNCWIYQWNKQIYQKGCCLSNICKTSYYSILTLIFGNFWRHLEISGIWDLEIGILGNPPKFAGFVQFQCMGYFSHSVELTDFDFELRISNFQFFWNLEIGNLEILKKWLVLANFNILGIFPTQLKPQSMVLNS